MDKYINIAEIAFAFKEEEVAAQYGGKNDISTGVLFALDTLELDMPESIVRCKDCKFWKKGNFQGGNSLDRMEWGGGCPIVRFARYESDFCSKGERRSDD